MLPSLLFAEEEEKGCEIAMYIYRPKDGVYRCISDPVDIREYVMVEAEGCYPTLVPIQDGALTAAQGSDGVGHGVPIPNFTEECIPE
ncbi:MAG: hypothetical protein QM697_18875 [Lachnospiraceae bacterium]